MKKSSVVPRGALQGGSQTNLRPTHKVTTGRRAAKFTERKTGGDDRRGIRTHSGQFLRRSFRDPYYCGCRGTKGRTIDANCSWRQWQALAHQPVHSPAGQRRACGCAAYERAQLCSGEVLIELAAVQPTRQRKTWRAGIG